MFCWYLFSFQSTPTLFHKTTIMFKRKDMAVAVCRIFQSFLLKNLQDSATLCTVCTNQNQIKTCQKNSWNPLKRRFTHTQNDKILWPMTLMGSINDSNFSPFIPLCKVEKKEWMHIKYWSILQCHLLLLGGWERTRWRSFKLALFTLIAKVMLGCLM